MRILFVLPAPVRVPMGGAAVVYRHAEGLAARGHEVTVAAPQRPGITGRLLRAAVKARDTLQRIPDAPWYRAAGVTCTEPASPADIGKRDQDAVIATGHQTARSVTQICTNSDAAGLYFIQGDERALDASAGETWDLPLTRIPVAEWLAAALRDHGHPVAGVVPNAVDPAQFAVVHPLGRRPDRLIALYHRHPVKGPTVLIEALRRIRASRPTVSATIVSARPPSHRLPSWVTVEIRPDAERMRDLYNASAVCLHTSRIEGWGLVPMEAAACGCAVVATASLGPREYLTDGRSMIEVAVGDANAVADAALSLFADPARRVRVAEAAVQGVSRFSWDRSTDRFEALIVAAVDR